MRSAFGQQFDVPSGYLNTAGIGIPSAHADVAEHRERDERERRDRHDDIDTDFGALEDEQRQERRDGAG